jgi:hypothetical protein
MATHRHRYAPLVGPTTTTGWTAMVTMEITGKTVYNIKLVQPLKNMEKVGGSGKKEKIIRHKIEE